MYEIYLYDMLSAGNFKRASMRHVNIAIHQPPRPAQESL